MNLSDKRKADIEADLLQVLTLPELAIDKLNFSLSNLLQTQSLAELCQINAEQLQAFGILHSKRLGIYYELLWRTLLENASSIQIQLQNQQVIDNKLTLGEFDFILEDTKRQQNLHLEIAIKFYLNTSHLFSESKQHYQNLSANADFWRGPNSSDSLKKKYRHLIDKQLQLSRQPAAQTLLAEHHIEDIHAQFSLKGFLFNHWQHDIIAPVNFSNKAKIYLWLYINELDEYLKTQATNSACELFIIEKPAWIRQQHQQLQTIDQQTVKDILKDKDSPVLLAWAENKNGLFLEKQRFFVAPMNWPTEKTKQCLS